MICLFGIVQPMNAFFFDLFCTEGGNCSRDSARQVVPYVLLPFRCDDCESLDSTNGTT